jgi:hypothetical protein
LKRDGAFCDLLDAVIGDGHAMGVAPDVVQHPLGTGEGRLGVDDPFIGAERLDVVVPLAGIGEMRDSSGETEFAGVECLLQILEEQATGNSRDSTRTGRKKPGRQAIQRLGSGDIPPPGTTQCRWG